MGMATTERCTAVVVNWNSGTDLAAVLVDLAAQRGVDLSIVVVDNGSSDASVATAQATSVEFRLELTVRASVHGGNNLAARLPVRETTHLFVVNPDVSLPDATTLACLFAALSEDGTLAAVAPRSRRSGAGRVPGQRDRSRHATAVHTQTHVRPN